MFMKINIRNIACIVMSVILSFVMLNVCSQKNINFILKFIKDRRKLNIFIEYYILFIMKEML